MHSNYFQIKERQHVKSQTYVTQNGNFYSHKKVILHFFALFHCHLITEVTETQRIPIQCQVESFLTSLSLPDLKGHHCL